MSKYIPLLIKYFLKINALFERLYTQHIILVMIEKMKTSRDYKQFCAAILTDPSKAFDITYYDLATA